MDKKKLTDIFDIPILRHGFTEYNRDYDFLVELDPVNVSGHFILRFKHVYELTYLTTVTNDTLKLSTDDIFTNHQKWKDNGEKLGFVWGVNNSSAYPGFSVKDTSDKADKWIRILGLEMFEVSVETETFKIDFVTHDFELIDLKDNKELIFKTTY